MDLFRKKGGERRQSGWVLLQPKQKIKLGGEGEAGQEEVVLGTQSMALQSRYCKVAGI